MANIAIAVHMYSAFQVFAQVSLPAPSHARPCAGLLMTLSTRFLLTCLPSTPPPLCPFQPLFETIESWVKASRIKRHLRKARGAASTAIENTDADDFKPSLPGVAEAPSGSIPSGSIASPFDSAASGLVPLPEGAAISAAESGTLDTLGSAQRSGLGSRPLSVRLTASGIAVCNSAPIPTLLPPGGEQTGGGWGEVCCRTASCRSLLPLSMARQQGQQWSLTTALLLLLSPLLLQGGSPVRSACAATLWPMSLPRRMAARLLLRAASPPALGAPAVHVSAAYPPTQCLRLASGCAFLPARPNLTVHPPPLPRASLLQPPAGCHQPSA